MSFARVPFKATRFRQEFIPGAPPTVAGGPIPGAALQVDTAQLFRSLMVTGQIKPYSLLTAVTIPSNTTLTIRNKVPTNTVLQLSQFRLAFDQDHSLSFNLSLDDGQSLSYTDTDLVQMRYTQPVSFLDDFLSPIVVTRQAIITVTNNTLTTQYFSEFDIGSTMDVNVWDSIVENYFSKIQQAVEGS